MQFAVGSFVMGSGLTQTVTGVTDKDGADLTTDLVMFQFGGSVINTLTASQPNGYVDFRGIDTGSIRSALSVIDGYSGFNFKMASGAQSLGDHSIVSGGQNNFGSFDILRTGKISGVAPGQFDLTFDTNAVVSGDTILYVAFAGIDYDFISGTSGVKSTSAFPRGLINFPLSFPASSGPTASGTGGQNLSWGFASSSDGNAATTDLYVVNQGNNFSAQRTDRLWAIIDGSTGILSANAASVSSWDDASITITDGSGSVNPLLVFCGEDLICASGAIVTGDTVIETGIDVIAIMFMSSGYAASASVQSPVGQFCRGWSDGVSQWGYWSGEKTNGNSGPSYGARIAFDDAVIRIGPPLGDLTVFTAIGTVDEINSVGQVLLDWTGSGDEEILWFALGVAIPPLPPTAGGGIYVLVPQKKQDTVWLAVDPEDTALFKIPDPNAFTALVGDE